MDLKAISEFLNKQVENKHSVEQILARQYMERANQLMMFYQKLCLKVDFDQHELFDTYMRQRNVDLRNKYLTLTFGNTVVTFMANKCSIASNDNSKLPVMDGLFNRIEETIGALESCIKNPQSLEA